MSEPKDPLIDGRDIHIYGGLFVAGVGGCLDLLWLAVIGAALWYMGVFRADSKPGDKGEG